MHIRTLIATLPVAGLALKATSAAALTIVTGSLSALGVHTDIRTGGTPAAVRMVAQQVSSLPDMPWWCIDPFVTAQFSTTLTFTKISLADFVAQGKMDLDVASVVAGFVNQGADGTLRSDFVSGLVYQALGGPINFANAATNTFFTNASAAASFDPKYQTLKDMYVLVSPTGSNGAQFTQNLLGRMPSVSNVVPEPASWAMLIAGFGLVGAAARRRRRTIVLA